MVVRFEISPEKVWCCLNISEDCLGYIDLLTMWVDEEGQPWNICTPCAEQEKLIAATVRKVRCDS